MALKKANPDVSVNVFLMGDAVSCAMSGQKTPDGYYYLERMVRGLITKKVTISCCGTCQIIILFDKICSNSFMLIENVKQKIRRRNL